MNLTFEESLKVFLAREGISQDQLNSKYILTRDLKVPYIPAGSIVVNQQLKALRLKEDTLVDDLQHLLFYYEQIAI